MAFLTDTYQPFTAGAWNFAAQMLGFEDATYLTGYGSVSNCSDGEYIYSIITDSDDNIRFGRYSSGSPGYWEELTPPTFPHSFGGGHVMDGKAYFFAGTDTRSFTDSLTVSAYDIAGDSWSTPTTVPTGGSGYSYYGNTSSWDGWIYKTCGYGDGANPEVDSRHHRYNPGTNTWEELAPVPWACDYGNGTFAPDGLFYFMGDYGIVGTYPDVIRWAIYDPDTDTWDEQGNPPQTTDTDSRVWLAEDAIGFYNPDDNAIWWVGGGNYSFEGNAIVRALELDTMTWTSRDDDLIETADPYPSAGGGLGILFADAVWGFTNGGDFTTWSSGFDFNFVYSRAQQDGYWGVLLT